MRQRPYESVLEFVREGGAGDPFAFRAAAQTYALRRADGTYKSAELAWDETLLAELEALEHFPPEPSVAQRLGDRLRHFLEQVGWELEAERIAEALRDGRPVHLTFRFAAAELYALPWELVTAGASGKQLGALPGCFIRYEWPGSTTAPRKPDPPPEGGRILFAWSTAGGAVPADHHLRALRRSCERAGRPFNPARDVLSNVSMRSLDEALSAPGERVAVLHLLCHGSTSETQETSGLLWDGRQEGGGTELVDGAALGKLLAPHAGTLRLVVLAACQSGGAGGLGNHLGSVAQALHRSGLAAVVASRLPLSVPGALELTETLYEKLLVESCSLEESLGAVRARQSLAATRLDWASLQLYSRVADGLDRRPIIFRPYRGLLAFQPQDSRFFFGREGLADELLRRVEGSLTGQGSRFQVIAGASGSGKSSLVQAGLLPRLEASSWDVVRMRPGETRSEEEGSSTPVQAHQAARRMGTLARLWAELHKLGAPSGHGTGTAPGYEEVLAEAARLRHARPERRLLVVVDQFEEIFTHVADAAEREAFIRALWSLAQQPALNTVVVATLRVDFLARCGELLVDDQGRRLDTVVYSGEHRLFVSQLQAEALELVITGPAHSVGLEFEEGIIDRLREEVEHEPGALPLLEYALDLMWEHREGRRLTHRAYDRIGGVSGALTRTADRLFDSLSEGEKSAARKLLVSMVDFRDGTTTYTRRRVWLREVRPTEGAAQAHFDSALARLVDSRLLVKEGSEEAGEEGVSVQVAHEALIRGWARLREWVQADQEALRALRELQSWAQDWREHRQDPDHGVSYLLTGSRLGYAQEVQKKQGGGLALEFTEFIHASHQQHLRREKRFQRRLLGLLAMAMLAALVMGGLAHRASQERARASEAAQQASAARLEAESATHRAQGATRLVAAQGLITQDPTTALLLLREVEDQARGSAEWVREAQDVLQQPVTRTLLDGHRGAVTSIDFDRDAERVVTGTRKGEVKVWPSNGQGAPVVLAEQGAPIHRVVFSPDGARVLAVSADGLARVWSLQTTKRWSFAGHTGPVLWGAFSPSGSHVATAGEDGTARLWNLEAEAPPVELHGHLGPIHRVEFSPEGSRVVTASRDGTARVWRAEGLVAPVVLRGHLDGVISAMFSPDGRQILTAGEDSTARVWNATGEGQPLILGTSKAHGVSVASRAELRAARGMTGHRGELTTAVFSPGGTQVLTAAWDHSARLWDLATGNSRELAGHKSVVFKAVFNRSGDQVLTASADATVGLWSASDGLLLRVLRGHRLSVLDAVFSPDGKSVASASVDTTARIWALEPPFRSTTFIGHRGAVWSVAISPDGQQIATASKDRTTRLWSREGRLLTALVGHEDEVRSVAFSPDNMYVLTASQDRTARLWPARGSDPQPRATTVLQHPAWVQAVAFSPNGRLLATAASDHVARVYTLVTNPAGILTPLGPPVELRGHTDTLRSVAFSPDSKRVVTASQDGTARIWSVDGVGTPIVLSGHEDWVRFAAFSPDGTQLLTASQDGMAWVWALKESSASRLRQWPPHAPEAALRCASWSPDGKRIVLGGADRLAHLWSLGDATEPLVLAGHADDVTSVVFSPDGAGLLTGSADGTARLWDIQRPPQPSDLQERLHLATAVCLSSRQRMLYLGERGEEAQATHARCEESKRSPSAPPSATAPAMLARDVE